MPTIKSLLNRIKWDKNLDPDDFIIVYDDKGSSKEIAYSEIKEIEGRFMRIEKDGRDVEIPIYRIVEIRQKDKVVFRR